MVKKIRETEEIKKHTLNLFAGDYETIQNMFPDIGAAVVIRRLVRNFVEEKCKTTAVDLPNTVKVNIDV